MRTGIPLYAQIIGLLLISSHYHAAFILSFYEKIKKQSFSSLQ